MKGIIKYGHYLSGSLKIDGMIWDSEEKYLN